MALVILVVGSSDTKDNENEDEHESESAYESDENDDEVQLYQDFVNLVARRERQGCAYPKNVCQTCLKEFKDTEGGEERLMRHEWRCVARKRARK